MEAPHADKNIGIDRKVEDNSNDINFRIYNYLIREKWVIKKVETIFINNPIVDIFKDFKKK